MEIIPLQSKGLDRIAVCKKPRHFSVPIGCLGLNAGDDVEIILLRLPQASGDRRIGKGLGRNSNYVSLANHWKKEPEFRLKLYKMHISLNSAFRFS